MGVVALLGRTGGGRAAVTPAGPHRDVAGVRGLVGAPQRPDGGGADGLLRGHEALADYAAEVVPDHVFLGRYDLVHADGAGLPAAWRLDQQDPRAGRDRVRVFDVERSLAGPADHVGVVRVEGGDLARGPDDPQRRRVGHALGAIEGAQVAADGRRAVRVDDDDRRALAGDPAGVERGQVVRLLYLDRVVAGDLHRLLALGRGRRACPGFP